MNLVDKIDKSKLPQHIAIIMDGNGRWAKEHHKPRVFGHKNGVTSVRSVVEGAAEVGIKFLTLYAFSTENWKRPKLEVTALMQLLVNTISKEINDLDKNNVRLLTIGNIESLPKDCYNELLYAKEKTKNNTGLSLVLALSYSSKWEITDAIKKIAWEIENKKLSSDSIDESTLDNYLNTFNMPDPELLIRTSGEYRISNFLLWQIAYAELYFTNKHWPDFRKEDLFEAIFDFQNRERRFGLISEQIKN
ncbi:MAG: isoprenyl transferase [Flavobacteriales bacterium CG18_big_fil_WC_8_21_14_2_50_32_9]|nr:isoprenyl transferase [Flavobacteriales bacterium]PIQ16248.1 MAG: isoprenyl transferase [Flavobacteriales bacterium CG18_big_fil_WC_8_21_14_2_50_32_9]PIZ05874.1 MAG: isoprenyl transferase [Flavobacteriales bacterium CG_4_10_14_0_8_um_filter_32_5]PJC62167.1 MAG: isoprenyl transferase [Flavobacteriales bacterium CG_4_9_14_0_2_um_filter_32_27]